MPLDERMKRSAVTGRRAGYEVRIRRRTETAVHCQEYDEETRLSVDRVVSYRVSISAIGYRLSHIGYRLSDIGYRISDIECRISDLGIDGGKLYCLDAFRSKFLV
jgi:hypothetical protein